MTPVPEYKTDDGILFSSCGVCTAVVRQKNMAFVVVGEQCDRCKIEMTIEQPELNRELEWCQCGDTELVDKAMMFYLLSLEKKQGWKDAGFDEVTFSFVAYIADKLDWTDHGTSIYGAWLTPLGTEVLKNFRKIFEETEVGPDGNDPSGIRDGDDSGQPEEGGTSST